MRNQIEYFVGDPSILLPSEIWKKCCEILKRDDIDDVYQEFNTAVANALADFTGYRAYVSEIGRERWSNVLSGEKVLKPDFVCDSGFVCVCRITRKGSRLLYETYGGDNYLIDVALFNASPRITVEFDRTEKNWTVIRIKDYGFNKDINSLEHQNKDEDEEDF